MGKRWGRLLKKTGLALVENESDLIECLDGFGDYLQWKRWEFMDIFRKLGVSDFIKLQYIHKMCN